jgi:hypothetical protein
MNKIETYFHVTPNKFHAEQHVYFLPAYGTPQSAIVHHVTSKRVAIDIIHGDKSDRKIVSPDSLITADEYQYIQQQGGKA